MTSPYVLVLYYSKYGNTKKMADYICNGIERTEGITALARTVPELKMATEQASVALVPEQGAPYVSLTDLENCAGLVIGSPTRFGNMAAPLKYFLDQTSNLWLNGKLAGKPAACFTSTGSLHGGMESTLLSMMLPLMHHGMIICGVPYTEEKLLTTSSGGTPYGATHLAGASSDREVDTTEKTICVSVGARIAKLALQLAEV